MMASLHSTIKPPRGITPTPAQIRILDLLANGLTQKQIAAVMGIRYETTRMHMKNVRKRLAFETTEQAVAVAVKRGWIEFHDP